MLHRLFGISWIIISVLIVYSAYSQSDFTNPHGNLQMECQTCHTTSSFIKMKKDSEFDHSSTGFPLVGTHQTTDCMSCHGDLEFSKIAVACADCHTDVHRSRLGFDCQSCHTPIDWESQEETFDLHLQTGFPLTGMHAVADCQACHVDGQQGEFLGTPTDCISCHEQDFAATINPNHQMAAFSFECMDCHSALPMTWTDVRYEHTELFELRGAHLETDCMSCHDQGYAGISQDCISCHQVDYNNAREPDHAAFGFPQDCAVCHTETRWDVAEFEHLEASGFALNGAHALADCNSCHVNNQLTGLPRDCMGCHQADYEAAVDPNHVANMFPTDCMVCHSESNWETTTFDHNLTDFPLTGAHIFADCASCHVDGQFAGTPKDCFSCHLTDFNGVDDPDHVANNFDHDCLVCHTTNDWENTSFNHANTDFPLTGAHTLLDCASCHSEGFDATPIDCYSCHQSDFVGVEDPNHVTNNFDHDCLVCHTTDNWDNPTFDHGNTDFPLTGAHTLLDCASCHAEGYDATPLDCYSCHQSDYNNVDDPDHVANNFDHDCTMCHTTDDWESTTFDHNQTEFPLTGAHALADCQECHQNGFDGTPTECASCHQDDYDNTDHPNHAAAGFPLECEVCHNTTDWDQTNWNHDLLYFPIYSGNHQNEWDNCQDCHVNPQNYMVFECIFCHEHNQPDMDDEHDDVPGYVYLSQACYDCHPNGNELMPMFRSHQ